MPPFEREVRRFIIDNFLFGEEGNGLSSQDSLLEKGILDSTGVLELVGFLQDAFGINIEDHDIIPANLDSISNIVRFVHQKKGNGGADGQSIPV